MKRLFLFIIMTSLLTLNMNAQFSSKEENKYTVNAHITTPNQDISPNATVTCYFSIYEYGQFVESIVKTLNFTGDGDYVFKSGYAFTPNSSWRFEMTGSDGQYCFDDNYDFQEDWEVFVEEEFVYHCNWQ